MDEGSDILESLKCDGMCNGGVWGVGVEAFPVVAIVVNEVGDCAEDLVWYDGGHGVVRRRGEKPIAFLWEEKECEDVEGERRGGDVKVFWRWLLFF